MAATSCTVVLARARQKHNTNYFIILSFLKKVSFDKL
jgi:hypothetical protein